MADVVANGTVEVAKPHEGYTLKLADKDTVRVVWPFVLYGLEKIKQKDPTSGFWIPEHVRASIEAGLAGRMFCELQLILDGESKPVGFLVFKMYNDEFVQVPVSLFVWIAYCRDPLALRNVLPLVEKRAKDMGLRYVDGVTSRAQWGERLKKHGYKIHQLIIRKDLRASSEEET